MNQHKQIWLRSLGRALFKGIAGWFFCWNAVANDFLCLKALLPATTHPWFSMHRSSFATPILSPSGDAIAITKWDHDHLTGVYVYTENASKRYDRINAIDRSQSQDLRGLSEDWLKSHRLATKLESFEVFQIQAMPPGGWRHKVSPFRATASQLELGGWLEEGENSGDVMQAIRDEIAVRENWVRNTNLNADRFKAWSKSEKYCPHN